MLLRGSWELMPMQVIPTVSYSKKRLHGTTTGSSMVGSMVQELADAHYTTRHGRTGSDGRLAALSIIICSRKK